MICVDYNQTECIFDLFLCNERRKPIALSLDETTSTLEFYHWVCTSIDEDGKQCGHTTRLRDKDGNLYDISNPPDELYLCCPHCGRNFGRVPTLPDDLCTIYFLVLDKLVQARGEPLTEEQKKSIKEIIDRYWSEANEEERVKKRKEEWEKRKTRLTEEESANDGKLLRPVRRRKHDGPNWIDEPCDSCKEKAEPSNRPTYGELYNAYGKIAEARSLLLQAMSHIDPLDERVDARVLPDLNAAYSRLDLFLDRKLREPILKEVLGKLPESTRGEE